jgi:hypothetical protein
MPGTRLIHVCILVLFVITGCEEYEHCPPGQSWCWAQCVDLVNDDENCGQCDNQCVPHSSCRNGECNCVGGYANCYGDCVNLKSEQDHCGVCGNACGLRESCINGICEPFCGCDEPLTCCAVDNTEICVDTNSDEAHCGACGLECGIGRTCCDGSCVNTISEDAHCGACGNRCNSNQFCDNGYCVNLQFRQPGDPCAYDTVNEAAGDCSEGLVCLGTLADGSFGTCPNGNNLECEWIYESYNPDCVNGNCGYSFCSEVCNDTWECPSGFAPQDCNGTCYCIPSTPASWGAGGSCHFGDVHEDHGCCPPGLRCLGWPADGNSGTCPGGDPAECTQYPPSHNPDCVNGNCGYSFCVSRCDVVGNCERGLEPLDVNGICYCIPSIADSQAGEPCPFGNMNDFSSFCEDGLTCLGNDDTGSCPGGSVSECIGPPESWHPDCADGICGFSFCSEECDPQGNCPLGFVPAEVSGACYCIPADPGGSQAGDPCPISDTNLPHDNCAAGLTCVGGHSGTCPGGSPAECTEFPASWNPDCVNGSCGYSFCAYQCDAQGNCPAGFWPQDLGSACYCMPD